MSTYARLILSLLLIAAAAFATATMRDAGWIANGGPLTDGAWSADGLPDASPAYIGITPEEALTVGRRLDLMLAD